MSSQATVPTLPDDIASRPRRPKRGQRDRPLFERELVGPAIKDSFRKLDPRAMVHNPVMFVVEIGSVLCTLIFFRDFASSTSPENVFTGLVAVWLWFTVLFANFAEAIAEGRGKAQAATLRAARADTIANVRRDDGTVEHRLSSELALGDVVLVAAGEVIPGDGEIIEGIASVDESAITGESAPVIRESGGDRSAVTGGTRVLSDHLVIRITSKPGETFLDRMIALVEGADRQKTPNEIALNILLAALTIIFLIALVTLQPFAIYSGAEQKIVVLVALLVCLIPTTIGALLSAIGIAGMDRLVQRNVLALSGRAVEAAGDVSTLLLDKTGTITYGNRRAAAFHPLAGVEEGDLVEAALLSSLADETPEGRSIVDLAHEKGCTTAEPTRRSADPVHGADPDVGRRLRQPVDSQGRGRRGEAPRRRRRGSGAHRPRPDRRAARAGGQDPAGGLRGRAHPRCDRAEGHGQARDARALRADAGHGHSHRDDHR